MKNITVKQKLIAMTSALVLSMIATTGFELYETSKIRAHFLQVTEVQLPAVKNMLLIDMMHDGLSSNVYRSFWVSENPTEEDKKSVLADVKEYSSNLTSYISNIESLVLNPDSERAVSLAKPEIEKYTQVAQEIVALAFTDRKAAAQKLPDFQASFHSLETKLQSLSELIEKDAEKTKELGLAQSKEAVVTGVILTLLGAIFGGLLSFYVIRDLMKNLGKVVKSLTDSSSEVYSASLNSATSASELSEASTQQAASLQETMSSIEEISAMVAQNAESANKARSTVEDNKKATKEGSQSVSDMVSAIGEIKDTNDKILKQMEDSNKEFSEIVKIISEIGDKTKVINDIVFQTKLLSFNASVEAARAGEHGKGFAVVAEEVGNLARMSGSAAKEISDMLSHSIGKVNSIVEQTTSKVDELVEIGKDKISMGQSTAQKCKEALNIISQNAESVTTMVSEIASASKEQAQGVQEINKAISQLDQVTQQNSAVAQKSSAQSEQLQGESQSLSHTVKHLQSYIGIAIEVPPSRTSSKAKTESNRKSSNLVSDRVMSLEEFKNRPKVEHTQPKSASHKKVVGGEDVPSGDDPNFEEF